MTGQPTAVTSRRRQHELLRSWATWAMTSILIDPGEVAQVREAGWSGTHHRDPETGKRIVGTSQGLGFGVDESWGNPDEVIPWPEVEAIARAVPRDVREALIEIRSRRREHAKAYPRFTASGAAAGCGPIVDGEPLTERQEAYVRELEEFEASGVLPAWETQRAALEVERLELHARALEDTAEPGDLLELLEDRQVASAGPRPAAGDREQAPRVQEPVEQITAPAQRATAGQRPALREPAPRPRSTGELHPTPATVQTGVAR